MRYAFSLVELSIVLVILGLLTGGILAGKSLIRAAELRSVSTEYQRYTSAVYAFRDRYFALPGDMTNATSVWGKDATNCNGNTGNPNTPGTCNGNGDGLISLSGVVGGTVEAYQAWKQLALAGLVEGSYTGLGGGPTISTEGALGVNRPASRAGGGAGWGLFYYGTISSHFAISDNAYGNAFVFAGDFPGTSPYHYVITPEEAWNIDTKLDDGKPQTGKIWAIFWALCTTAASSSAINGDYKLTETNAYCSLIWPKMF